MNRGQYQMECESQYRTVSEGAVNKVIRNVYLWMAGALAISALTGFYIYTSPYVLQAIFSTSWLFPVVFIAELVLVMVLSSRINKMSSLSATLMFLLYSVLNGLTFACVFIMYELASVLSIFVISAVMFGVMALIGSLTKKDLTSVGNILTMALLGLVLVMVVNIFVRSSVLEIVLSAVGVLIFVGLIAYDAQKLKEAFSGMEDNDHTAKYAVLGALTLYLDFINLFLFLLRLFGRRR